MSILWADGFDDWSTTSGMAGEYESFTNSGGAGISAGNGRRGAALMFANISDTVKKTLPSSYSEIFVSLAFKPAGFAGTQNIVVLNNGATQQLSVGFQSDGSLIVWRNGPFGTSIGTSAAGVIVSSAFTHLQIRCVCSTTVGVCQIRVNGSTSYAVNLSSVNTGGASINSVQLYVGITGSSYYDDFVINDTAGSIANGFLGDTRVDTYLPSGNGDLSQMVGSDSDSTNNYALVNAAAPSASNYVQTSTVSNEDLYATGDISHNPATIYGAVVTASALKDDAGTRSIRLHAKSGSTDAASAADIALSTSRTRVATVFEADPNTSAAWTKTGFNAAQFGFAVTV